MQKIEGQLSRRVVLRRATVHNSTDGHSPTYQAASRARRRQVHGESASRARSRRFGTRGCNRGHPFRAGYSEVVAISLTPSRCPARDALCHRRSELRRHPGLHKGRYSPGQRSRHLLHSRVVEEVCFMKRKGQASRCPTCGRLALRPKERTVSTRVGKREVKVPDIPVEECSICGERLYDLAALRRIAAARAHASRGHAA
jgi:YgiT-type zinc finger domain-containing protein